MKTVIILVLCLFSIKASAQQTVGLFQYTQQAYPGYTLFAPGRSETTYLIDNCGDLHFTWQSAHRPGNAVELLDDGTLIRACNWSNGSPITAGGGGGRIEAIQPDQQIAWFFEYANDSVRQHHDFEVLPNGNLLIIAWELRTQQEAIDYGRDPAKVGGAGIWPEQIIEYNPTIDSIVWKWHAWDHVVQDFDPGKPNYGVVADHPELFDLNFDKGNASPDWQHMNAVHYNADLDQILLCSPAWNEIYIIDHSTTTAEAASHTGGNSGKGGDILWRWGNPEQYGAGDSTDQQLYYQHDAQWIPNGYRNAGDIIIYNNGRNRTPVEYSSVDIISPTILPNGDYDTLNGTFLPATFAYTYTAPTPTDFYSRIISSAQMLPNGNILIDEGVKGHFFEIDSLDNVVWDYVNPVVQDSILAQEEPIPGTTNLFNMCFRARRIYHDDPAISALPLVNQGPIELNPYTSTCQTQIGVDELVENEVVLYPNPVNSELYIEGEGISSVQLINVMGEIMGEYSGTELERIDIQNYPIGVYIARVQTDGGKVNIRFIKQ